MLYRHSAICIDIVKIGKKSKVPGVHWTGSEISQNLTGSTGSTVQGQVAFALQSLVIQIRILKQCISVLDQCNTTQNYSEVFLNK